LISIDQMERAPKNWSIQEYKKQEMFKTKHFLDNMISPSMK
jgi:hypothetical protein